MAKKKNNQGDDIGESIDSTVDEVVDVSIGDAEALIDSIMPDEPKPPTVREARRLARRPESTRSLEKTMKMIKNTRKVRFY